MSNDLPNIVGVTNLVPKEKVGCLAKKLDYEVLVFVTQIEFDNANSEQEMRKRIRAKFRCYQDAFDYAHRLAKANTYYHKIILRA